MENANSHTRLLVKCAFLFVNLPGQAKNATIATIATICAKIRGSSYFDHIACMHTIYDGFYRYSELLKAFCSRNKSKCQPKLMKIDWMAEKSCLR